MAEPQPIMRLVFFIDNEEADAVDIVLEEGKELNEASLAHEVRQAGHSLASSIGDPTKTVVGSKLMKSQPSPQK